jgi:hypothetical protein
MYAGTRKSLATLATTQRPTVSPNRAKPSTNLGMPIASNTLHKLNKNCGPNSMNTTRQHDHSIADLTAICQVDVCQAGTPCSKSLESRIGDLTQQTPTTTQGAEISPVVGRTASGHTHASDIVQHKAFIFQSPSSRRANPNKGEHV